MTHFEGLFDTQLHVKLLPLNFSRFVAGRSGPGT
jgi:hypothetical protein